jgi:hypothetical protein
LPVREIAAVDVGDFQFAARGGLHFLRMANDVVAVEIEPGHGPLRARLRQLFLDRGGAPLAVRGDDAVSLRVGHLVGKNGRAEIALRHPAQELRRTLPIEDAVA